MIDKARAKLLIQLPSMEDLQIDLYVARSDFQRALLHNEKLMRDLTSLRESVSVGEAKEMAAEIERLVAEVATLREDVRDADQEVVRWRARAEQFEMQLSGCTGHDRT
jgi:predicted nuclease with TOPRIM domain